MWSGATGVTEPTTVDRRPELGRPVASDKMAATVRGRCVAAHRTRHRGGSVQIGLLGGTGDQGRGLARRFAIAGHAARLGSRDPERAAAAASALGETLPGGAAGLLSGAANEQVAADCDLLVVAVPFEGHAALLGGLAGPLAGKIVVDCVNPLGFDKQGAFALHVEEGSAAQQAASLLPDSRVVAAFHHVSAVLLLDPDVTAVDTDVLVLGDDRQATDTVIDLAGSVEGMRGIYAGRLRNAAQVEALTANLISVNRRYKAHAGLRVTDVEIPQS
jgi:NADPH-dependent F420 reductase